MNPNNFSTFAQNSQYLSKLDKLISQNKLAKITIEKLEECQN